MSGRLTDEDLDLLQEVEGDHVGLALIDADDLVALLAEVREHRAAADGERLCRAIGQAAQREQLAELLDRYQVIPDGESWPALLQAVELQLRVRNGLLTLTEVLAAKTEGDT